jgi:hypothetical protein
MKERHTQRSKDQQKKNEKSITCTKQGEDYMGKAGNYIATTIQAISRKQLRG